MFLTSEEWKQVLNTARSNNSSDSSVLEQIKTELQKHYQDIYEEWKQEGFNENHLFNVSLIQGDFQEHQILTLLHIAALNGCLDTIKYLVDEKKIDINKENDEGITALHLAIFNGHLDTIKYLVDEKKIDIKNYGGSVLYGAASNGHLDTIKYFVDEKKVDINKANYDGCSTLNCAAENGHLDIVQYCVDEKKVDINKANGYDNTALHYAALNGRIDVAEFLLSKGANPLLKNRNSKTPRDLADSENLKQLLKEAESQNVKQFLKEAENKQPIAKQEVSSISNVQPHNPRSTKGNKLPIITACAGLLLGLSIAYLSGAAALTPVIAAIAVFVVAAVAGALVGCGVGKVSQKLFVESINKHSKQELISKC